MPSGVRVIIFNRSGEALVEIEPAIESIAWANNREASASFFLRYNDPKCTENNLRFGNRVLVQFENGLPAWGGVIDPPLSQTPTGVRFTAYTASRLFRYRVTDKNRTYTDSPGGIFRELIITANNVESTGIILGNIYDGGTISSRNWHHDRIYNQIIRLADISGEDFSLDPSYPDSVGGLSFLANWYVSKGSDKSDQVLLAEGVNAQISLSRHGDLFNYAFVVGAGMMWGDARLVGEAENASSRSLYGLRQFPTIETNTDGQAALDASAAVLVARHGETLQRLEANTSDSEPGKFANYDIGDTVRVQAFAKGGNEWGIDGNYRVIARSWYSSNQVRAVLENT